MKILVTAKRIPDPTQKLKLKDNALDFSGANWQLNQFDEYAVEAALRLTEDGANTAVRHGQVTVASLGPADVATQLRSALAMGADKAIRVDAKDDELDASIVAKTLAKLVEREKPELVLMGKLAADNEGNDVGQRLAAILGWPQATFACSIQVVDGGKAVLVGREVDAGVEVKKVQLPAGDGGSANCLAPRGEERSHQARVCLCRGPALRDAQGHSRRQHQAVRAADVCAARRHGEGDDEGAQGRDASGPSGGQEGRLGR